MDTSAIDRIATLAIDHEPKEVHAEGRIYIQHHKDYNLVLTPIDNNRLPLVTRCNPVFYTTESFCEYVNAFKNETSRIFLEDDKVSPGAVCIIDYDTPSETALRVHRVNLELILSDEWLAWNALAAKRIGLIQEEFADFIEEHSLDIRAPSASDLYAMVTDMKVRRTVNWRKSVNLATGEIQAHFTDEGEAGAMMLPTSMDIAIPIFKGGDHYAIKVLIRYRISDGNMRMGIVLQRADAALNMALSGGEGQDGIKEIIAGVTGLPVYVGKPDAR